MKNTNKLFGRRLTKLILTPVLSIGLVAGFAVAPASATMDIDYPFGGEIGIVRTGNSFAWTTWIETAPKYNSSARETAFDTIVEFNVVACQASSVTITDCLGASLDPNIGTILVARGNFVGILQDDTLRTSTSSGSTTPTYLTEIAIDQNGKTSSATKWRAIDTSGINQGAIVALGAAAYKFYVFMWLKNQNFGSSTTYGVADYIQPYYASAPISVDFRPLSATPTISTQPASASKTLGDALSLSVSASGAGTLSYQWKKGGTAISGATSATYSIPSLVSGDAGSYTVDVINTESNKAPVTVTSNAAVVTVAAAPTPTPTPTVAPKAAIEFKIPEGKPVAAAPVDVEVEGLKDQSKYVITVRSTPIIVDQGTIFNSRLKTSIKIPAGLSPGWHSITIDATAADGSPWNEVMYFEVSASGLLKSTSTIRTANPGAIAFSAGTSVVSSATKKNLKATVKEAGKSAKYTITGSAGQLPGVSDKAVKALAKKRANVLKAYLVKLGVSKSSITIKTKVVRQGKKPKASVLALY